jgi:biopolymer transport protein ExbB/TolQ
MLWDLNDSIKEAKIRDKIDTLEHKLQLERRKLQRLYESVSKKNKRLQSIDTFDKDVNEMEKIREKFLG